MQWALVHGVGPCLAPLVARAAPALTIGGEAAIGLLLACGGSRRLVRWGTALALLLHLAIALVPPPNNATPFSLTCIIRLIVASAPSFAMAIDGIASGKGGGRLVAATAVAAAAAATASRRNATRRRPPAPTRRSRIGS